MENIIVPYVYLHINNGGVAFSIIDDNGPTLQIQATHFENETNKMRLKVDKKAFKELSNMFNEAYSYNFNEYNNYLSINDNNISRN